MTKHTQGQWTVSDCPLPSAETDPEDRGRVKLVEYKNDRYMGVVAIVQTPESEANAHLIAAAPELLEELEDLLLAIKHSKGVVHFDSQDVATLKRVVAKARGDE